MKVLLINPNRFKAPPVPPIGLEYLSGSLIESGHQVEIADLCFSDSPFSDINHAIVHYSPDLVGITVRNIDTVLFYNNEFFLDEIRSIVTYVRECHHKKVIIGGTGISTNPEGILSYVGADYAVVGPGEGLIEECLAELLKPGDHRKVFYRPHGPSITCRRYARGIDYGRYFSHGGIAGIETHKGCSSSCVYCIEANSPVTFKDPGDIAREITDIVAQGYSHFHLCDSEFNEDLDFAIDVCSAMKNTGAGIQWTAYMKPANYNRKLFKEMKDTGAYLITLTVDSWKKCPLYWSDIEKIVFSAKSLGIKVAIDFLAGFPYEQEDTLLWCLDFFRRIQPDSVGINTHIRLYKSLQISRIIMADENLKKDLVGDLEDPTLIRPVFYNHVSQERLKTLIGNESLFRIEGLSNGANYSRLSGQH